MEITLQEKFAFRLVNDPDQLFFAEYQKEENKYYVYWTENYVRQGVHYGVAAVSEFVTKEIWIIQDEA